MKTVALSKTEETALRKHEAVINQGLATFVEVGKALAEIRDSKLYRVEYSTFEEYCSARWDWSRGRAYELIEAASSATVLSANADKPTNAGQVKPLAGLAPAEKRKAWGRATEIAVDEGTPVRARHVQLAVREQRGKVIPISHKRGPKGHEPADQQIREWFIAAILAASKVQEGLGALSKLGVDVGRLPTQMRGIAQQLESLQKGRKYG